MNISKIEISNVKGIQSKVFELPILPNKPNILVAPNGFGKSSIAIAFDSLKRDKIELEDDFYFNRDNSNRPTLSISLTNGNHLTANDDQNEISKAFDIFIINN